MMKKFTEWWYFHVVNRKVRKGEKGGFKWLFRRFWLEISTLSGNFKARFTAAEHPYGYLIAGEKDDNIEGYCQMLYMVAMLLTTDQGFVDDVRKAINKYDKRLQKENPVVEDETEEKMALEEQQAVEYRSTLPRRYRKRADRETEEHIKEVLKRENDEKQGD